MKCLVVVNAHSVRKKLLKKLDYIRDRLSTRFDAVDIIFSERKGHIEELVKLNALTYHSIIICGGDGSLHEAVNGLLDVKTSTCILGIIPSGTVNDYARTLGLSKSLDVCLDAIIEGNYEYTDLMLNNGELGIYVCGFGAFTSSSYETNQKDKKIIGKIAYVLNGIKQIFTVKNIPVEITIDDEKLEKNVGLVLAYNSKSVAGMPIDLLADITDGKLDVVIFYDKPGKKRVSFGSFIKMVKMFFCGVESIKNGKHVLVRSIENIKITAKEPLKINMDGERAESSDINLKVLQKRLKIYAAKKW